MDRAASSHFDDLLAGLREEHEREITLLRSALLNSRLGQDPDDDISLKTVTSRGRRADKRHGGQQTNPNSALGSRMGSVISPRPSWNARQVISNYHPKSAVSSRAVSAVTSACTSARTSGVRSQNLGPLRKAQQLPSWQTHLVPPPGEEQPAVLDVEETRSYQSERARSPRTNPTEEHLEQVSRVQSDPNSVGAIDEHEDWQPLPSDISRHSIECLPMGSRQSRVSICNVVDTREIEANAKDRVVGRLSVRLPNMSHDEEDVVMPTRLSVTTIQTEQSEFYDPTDAMQFMLKSSWTEHLDMQQMKTIRQRQNQKGGESQGAFLAPSYSQLSAGTLGNAGGHRLDKYVSAPNSLFSFYADLLCMVMICLDLVAIPLQVFEPKQVFFDIMWWLTATYWTGDILRGFFTGFFYHGNVVVSFLAVRKKYLSRHFALDCMILTHDWLKILADQAGLENSNSFLRILYRTQAIRLLRVVKAFTLVKKMEDLITSELISVVWQVSKFFSGILVLNHLAACAWYWIGITVKESVYPTWVKTYLTTHSWETTIEYKYTTSFHWALTQFTPASIEVQPTNVYERIFAIVVLLFALLTTSTFVSGITSAVMRLAALKSAKSKQFWLLRRYLKDKRVPVPLAVKIHHYCDFAWDHQQSSMQEHNVQLISLLSTSLRAELRTSIFEGALQMHPFFILLGKIAPNTVQTLCTQAIVSDVLARGDCLFNRDEDADCMFYVANGISTYFFLDEHPQDLEIGTWLCEPCLWTQWMHQGTLQTRTTVDIHALDSEKFSAGLRSNLTARAEAADYGQSFVEQLNLQQGDQVSDLYQSPQLEDLWERVADEHGHVAQHRGHRHSHTNSGSHSLAGKFSGRSDKNAFSVLGGFFKKRISLTLQAVSPQAPARQISWQHGRKDSLHASSGSSSQELRPYSRRQSEAQRP